MGTLGGLDPRRRRFDHLPGLYVHRHHPPQDRRPAPGRGRQPGAGAVRRLHRLLRLHPCHGGLQHLERRLPAVRPDQGDHRRGQPGGGGAAGPDPAQAAGGARADPGAGDGRRPVVRAAGKAAGGRPAAGDPGPLPAAGGGNPGLCHLHDGPGRADHQLEPRGGTDHRLLRRRGPGPVLRPAVPGGGGGRRQAGGDPAGRRRQRPARGRGLADPQGRQPLPGQRDPRSGTARGRWRGSARSPGISPSSGPPRRPSSTWPRAWRTR